MTNPEHSFEEDVDPTVPLEVIDPTVLETSNYTETLSETDQAELDSLLADVITPEGYTGEPLPQISYKIYYSDQEGGRDSKSGEQPSFEEAVRQIVTVTEGFKELGLICYKIEIECVTFFYEDFIRRYRGI